MSLEKEFEDFQTEIDECDFAIRNLEKKIKSITQFVYTAKKNYENEDI